MRIFTKNVNFIPTTEDKNILQIEKYEEVFFDVYEIIINSEKFISEKIGEYDKNPIVKIPVEINGIKKDYPFILIEGKFQIIFNSKNEFIKESINENVKTEEFFINSFEKEFVDIQEKKNNILEYIENVKKTAKRQTDEYNKNQLKILEQQKEQNKKELQSLLESFKESWFQEFVDTSNKIKKELFDRLNINNSEIYESIDLKLEVISDDFKKLINEDFSNTEKIFENKIKELITEIYNNQVIKVINDGIDKISEQSEISFENIKSNFDTALSEKANDSDLIELHDLINEKIEENKVNITTYYNEKLDIVENKLIDLSDENRQYFIGLINESRDNLLKEIKSIKENTAIEYIVENKKTGEKKEIDINSIKSDLQKEISNKISNEIISLRKYTAYHSGGGGTVAQQFADGGTMNGSLNINGQILSGGVDIATIFSGGGGDININTLVRSNSADWNDGYLGYATLLSLSSNWQNTYTTVQTNSANWATDGYTSLNNLSSNWQNAYTNVQSNSSNWQNAYTNVQSNSSNWQNTFTTVQSNSSNWRDLYTTVQTNSANWTADGYITNIKNISGFTYTLSTSDIGSYIRKGHTSPHNIIIPTSTQAPFTIGSILTIRNTSTSILTISCSPVVTLNFITDLNSNILDRNVTAQVVCVGINEWDIV